MLVGVGVLQDTCLHHRCQVEEQTTARSFERFMGKCTAWCTCTLWGRVGCGVVVGVGMVRDTHLHHRRQVEK